MSRSVPRCSRSRWPAPRTQARYWPGCSTSWLGIPTSKPRCWIELEQVLGDRPVTFADIGRLPTLDRVIKEVLRLHVTGWILTRRTLTETKLGPWTLPAGTNLAYCQHALHRDPDLYPSPLRFDPDRWPDGAQELPPGALLPWGAGKHRCIGDRFATTELITALATILRTVRFTLAPGQTVRPVARATVRPGKMLMTVQERRSAAVH
ncbi:cytochrome P450 [Streptomyces sp. Qhu-G9]|uniref:cytochrome P450 n=1 Tax=Streptomyces sp. Qhu-G9 TaxID=3452799 RepID=UPI0022AC6867|nr:cytochrome P450 [Streptomyces aurantiacus]WAU86372.1 cytochrome P450 [Streptomyces aurantiacus]